MQHSLVNFGATHTKVVPVQAQIPQQFMPLTYPFVHGHVQCNTAASNFQAICCQNANILLVDSSKTQVLFFGPHTLLTNFEKSVDRLLTRTLLFWRVVNLSSGDTKKQAGKN
jgi:hypothetical protein